jgi:hypothetical protein
VFLEYAPIKRRYDTPYEKQSGPGQPDALAALDANLAVFPAATAQVLEYWLDVSSARFGRTNSRCSFQYPPSRAASLE